MVGALALLFVLLLGRKGHLPIVADPIYCKVRDDFTAHVFDGDGVNIGGQDDGYVPGFMPGNHYGDYLDLVVDLETGQIKNWRKPTAAEIEEFIAGERS